MFKSVIELYCMDVEIWIIWDYLNCLKTLSFEFEIDDFSIWCRELLELIVIYIFCQKSSKDFMNE